MFERDRHVVQNNYNTWKGRNIMKKEEKYLIFAHVGTVAQLAITGNEKSGHLKWAHQCFRSNIKVCEEVWKHN